MYNGKYTSNTKKQNSNRKRMIWQTLTKMLKNVIETQSQRMKASNETIFLIQKLLNDSGYSQIMDSGIQLVITAAYSVLQMRSACISIAHPLYTRSSLCLSPSISLCLSLSLSLLLTAPLSPPLHLIPSLSSPLSYSCNLSEPVAATTGTINNKNTEYKYLSRV